ncbi:putative leader peptide [Thermocrispum municipale]
MVACVLLTKRLHIDLQRSSSALPRLAADVG